LGAFVLTRASPDLAQQERATRSLACGHTSLRLRRAAGNEPAPTGDTAIDRDALPQDDSVERQTGHERPHPIANPHEVSRVAALLRPHGCLPFRNLAAIGRDHIIGTDESVSACTASRECVCAG
jgi:hypothetical protein